MKKQKRKNKRDWKQVLTLLLLLIVSGIIGFLGLTFVYAIPNFSFWDIIVAFLFFAISFPLHIVLHEVGHLLAGLLSGYQFIMFRLFHWVWIKTDRGISRRKQVVQGLLGQALMLPPADMDEPPMLFYHAGGLLLNLMTALFMAGISWWSSNPRLIFYLFISIAVALLLIAANILPQKGTDGYNILQMYKRPEAVEEMTTVLRLYAGMVQGKSFTHLQRFIPSTLPSTFENPNTVTLYTAQAAVYFEQGDFQKAREIYEQLWLNRKQLMHLHKPEVYLNYLFVLLLTDPVHSDVEKIKNTPIYKNNMAIEVADRYKIQATEAIYLEQDFEKAKQLLSKGEALIAAAPTVTEEKLEAQFYAYLRDEIRQFENETQLS